MPLRLRSSLSPVRNIVRSLVLDALSSHQKVQSERHLIRMRRTPGNNSRELSSIALDVTNLHQFGLDDLQVSHIRSACHSLKG